MTPRPTRDTEAGRTYLDLQNLARRTGRPTEEVHQLYVLECFLDRLVRSPYADRFVLKGGVLLAAYETRRPTRDVDLRAERLEAAPEAVRAAVCGVADVGVDDGVVFDTGAARAEVIREQDEYNGVRVAMPVRLASARMAFHVDVNVGDPVVPRPRRLELPRLRGGVVQLFGYPLAMVYAEKIVTMIERGEVNTRWRDFADVRLLASRHSVLADELSAALMAVAQHRGASLQTLLPGLDAFAGRAQRRWETWVRRQRLDDRLPESFRETLGEVARFADPVLAGTVAGSVWDPLASAWRSP
ncbi:nucleotidyltransferase AbiEii toxin of type IV toxin-antitoxin system [Streptomyces sp. Amel2xB2]|uniref:nucleotidyl transferase AbiEii/AbiGii toxin family protein n=1 Tax=Streptomyces sp. Amel2xB2 TaxID=1305829 RepID=UPI000DBF8107|nr:nucleotidyl transferase AbiEii/AbiGii toxin family protein [Streptomyces sp. Amel2xB2]RAJ58936.1 nucleotidyltransferase AbiEii toxin of type IV toxin-antitoxin system [Streptomyces sp. Amel2xB2]